MSTQAFDETQHPREPGGKFETKPVSEAPGGLDALGTEAERVKIFPGVYVSHDADDDTLTISGSVSISTRECLAPYMPDGITTDGREAWLNQRALPIEAFLQDEYGIRAIVGDDPWGYAQAEFEVTTTVDQAPTDTAAYLQATTRAGDLYRESDPGAEGNMWVRLGAHLRDHDYRVDEATESYMASALWTSGSEGSTGRMKMLDETHTAAGVDPQTRAEARAEISDFMTLNRSAIAKARESRPDYDDHDLGHDLILSRKWNDVGFEARGLGEVGAALHAAASATGARELQADADGKLRFHAGPANT